MLLIVVCVHVCGLHHTDDRRLLQTGGASMKILARVVALTCKGN